MNIQQTTNGWLASEQIGRINWKTFVYKDTCTIKLIRREENKVTDVYTLTLKEDSFTFSKWNNITLQITSTIDSTFLFKHLVWGIRTLRNQPFSQKERHSIHQELFGIPNLLADIKCSSELAQALYRKPGIESLFKLLFGRMENLIKFKKEFEDLYWSDLDAIYRCPWANKAEIIKEVGLGKGRYMDLFSCPKQFLKTIGDINPILIRNYWSRNLDKIPKKLGTGKEINNYIQDQLQQNNESIPKSLQNIKTILGDPVKERFRLGSDDIRLHTDKNRVSIKHLSPFPLLSIEGQVPPETEILICEELGIRSNNYMPSRLRRYEL